MKLPRRLYFSIYKFNEYKYELIDVILSQIACTVVAVLLHYFLLVSFSWMLVEGVYLYLMVITVFENNKEQLRIFGTCSYGR